MAFESQGHTEEYARRMIDTWAGHDGYHKESLGLACGQESYLRHKTRRKNILSS